MRKKYIDVIVVGTGVAGLYSALSLDRNYKVLMISKESARDCNSYLAQGGMSVLRDEEDFLEYREDTLKAGHYENRLSSVDTMIKNSKEILEKLLKVGVRFDRNQEAISYTREGGHSKRRIVHYKDETGKEIVEKLLEEARKRDNIEIVENTEMIDLLVQDNQCNGVVVRNKKGVTSILADYTILATGGIGGLFNNSTNFSHIKGDGIALVLNYNGKMKDLDYIQYHPTTLYDESVGRKHLLTEALRGEGAYILNSKGERFVNELLPRDLVTKRIREEMESEASKNVYLSMKHIPEERVKERFPYIYQLCRDNGLDLCKDNIPIVPGQHYYMGGIDVDENSMTSIDRLFAVGECSCNGVHGRNRLASNSLLESMVFASIVGDYINRNIVDSLGLDSLVIPKRNWDDYLDDSRERLKERIGV